MKNTAEHAERLQSLLSEIAPADPAPEVSDDPLVVLLESMMLWEASAEKAAGAMEKITQATVDFNDLRVTMEHELIDIIGARYPRAENRATRLRAVLRDVFLREHEMSLASLRDLGKREVRKYIETLDGIPPFAASRVLLLGFETHTIPVDGRLSSALAAAGACASGIDESDLSSWLSRQIKASDGLTSHFALQAWVDAGGKPVAGGSKKTTRTTKKKKTGANAKSGA